MYVTYNAYNIQNPHCMLVYDVVFVEARNIDGHASGHLFSFSLFLQATHKKQHISSLQIHTHTHTNSLAFPFDLWMDDNRIKKQTGKNKLFTLVLFHSAIYNAAPPDESCQHYFSSVEHLSLLHAIKFRSFNRSRYFR